MRGLVALNTLFVVPIGSLLLIAACSAGAEPGSSGAGSGNSSTAGTTIVPSAGSANLGGTTGIPIDPTSGSGGRESCNELTIVPEPVTPTVMVLVDNSSSMFEPRESLWDLLYSTLMDPTNGVVKSLESKVRFGFASYRGSPAGVMETDPTCAEIRSVPYSLDNHQAIDTLYRQLGTEWTQGVKWETPTGHAISRVAAELHAYEASPPGPKYILLVTDGDPNTCQVVDPQCGQDLSIRAVQDAHALGIKTLVVGIGSIIAGNPGCEARWGRCGPLHLQDLANAGNGLGVAEPPMEFIYQSCADRYGRVLQGAYSPTPGMEPFYTATTADQLKSSLSGLLTGVLSCTVEMNAIVNGDPALGKVTVGGQEVPFQDTNGWALEANRYGVTLQGAACERFKTLMPGEKLDIWFPCGVAVVR